MLNCLIYGWGISSIKIFPYTKKEHLQTHAEMRRIKKKKQNKCFIYVLVQC